jgi:hypothetical protein
VRRDGQKIQANFDPSERDVQGIKKLYEDKSFPQGIPILPHDPQHKFYDRAVDAFKQLKCF